MLGSQPRVLLDATAIPRDRGGVGRYVDGLVAGLAEVGADRRMVVACHPTDGHLLSGLAPNAEIVPIASAARGRGPRLVWEQVALAPLARKAAVDVIHSPHYTHPLATSAPLVVTLHDASFFTMPEVHTRLKRSFFRAWTRRAVDRADALVTVSATTRREVLREVGGDPSRFVVARLGVDPQVFHPPSDSEVTLFRRRHGLGTSPWVAFLGTLEPRKNVPALIRAWSLAVAGRRDPPALVLAGSRGWDTEVDSALREVPDGLRAMAVGYLPVEELAPLLGGAEVVVFPSLGEGFGLPVVEAMSCGSVVLTTPRLSLPEVGGDAVAYSEPTVPGLRAALSRLLDDAEQRSALAVTARQRAAQFTWGTCAEDHLRAYRLAAT